jgi:hypothetical protein
MADRDPDRPVTAAQRTVDEPSERVLQDRFTDSGDDSDGSGGGGDPDSPSPYSTRIDPGLVMAPAKHPLRLGLDMLGRDKAFSHLRLAVADLTDDPMRPVYTGYRDTEQAQADSMAKLALLPAAFGLREAARAAARSIPIDQHFLARLDKRWAHEIQRSFRPGKDAKNSRPRLDQILVATAGTSGGPGNVSFTNRFREQLVGALQAGTDKAAASCVQALGFPYLNAAVEAAGFYSRGKGLWVSLDYGGVRWDPQFTGHQQATTARALVELLVLVAQERLVAPGLGTEMRAVMSTSEKGGLHSFLADGIMGRLAPDDAGRLRYASKIGVLTRVSDCAFIERTSDRGTPLAFVAFAQNGASAEEIERAGVAIENCVLLAHGEPLPPLH